MQRPMDWAAGRTPSPAGREGSAKGGFFFVFLVVYFFSIYSEKSQKNKSRIKMLFF
jgi:hypothetical protein